MFLFYRLNDLLANELALKMEIKNLESTIMELEATNQVPIFDINVLKKVPNVFFYAQPIQDPSRVPMLIKGKLTFGQV